MTLANSQLLETWSVKGPGNLETEGEGTIIEKTKESFVWATSSSEKLNMYVFQVCKRHG